MRNLPLVVRASRSALEAQQVHGLVQRRWNREKKQLDSDPLVSIYIYIYFNSIQPLPYHTSHREGNNFGWEWEGDYFGIELSPALSP